MDKVFRRKLRRRTIRRFEKTRAHLIERETTKLLTLAQIRGKQKGMLGRFRAHGVPKGDRQELKSYRLGRCYAAACWFANRTTANELHRAALSILQKEKKSIHEVTIIDPFDYRAGCELSKLSITRMLEYLRRRFRLTDELLEGDIEIALEMLPHGHEVWSAHWHINVAPDATRDFIREALFHLVRCLTRKVGTGVGRSRSN